MTVEFANSTHPEALALAVGAIPCGRPFDDDAESGRAQDPPLRNLPAGTHDDFTQTTILEPKSTRSVKTPHVAQEKQF